MHDHTLKKPRMILFAAAFAVAAGGVTAFPAQAATGPLDPGGAPAPMTAASLMLAQSGQPSFSGQRGGPPRATQQRGQQRRAQQPRAQQPRAQQPRAQQRPRRGARPGAQQRTRPRAQPRRARPGPPPRTRPRSGPRRGFHLRGGFGYFGGHRGYRERRPGYRFYQGWWFPPVAFGAALSAAHIRWCNNRWRSYRVSDNSYQPYRGPRRQCVSPYGP